MPYPQIAMQQNRTIRIDYPRLFMDGEDGAYREFLIRGFEVEEVVSVEVDRLAGSAVVHLHPRCAAALDILMRLAGKYEEPRMRSFEALACPYFVLQDKGGCTIYSRAPETVTGIRRLLYGGLGVVFFGLSIVGVLMPLLPTAPFVILSSYFALRSSPGLNSRLLRSRLFGRILADWHQHRAMRRSTKKRVLIFMAIVFSATFGLARPSGSALPLALAIALLSFGFVLRMPTVKDEPGLPGITHQQKPLIIDTSHKGQL